MRHWCLEPTLAIAIWESALATARESSKSEAIWWRSHTGATSNCFFVRHLFKISYQVVWPARESFKSDEGISFKSNHKSHLIIFGSIWRGRGGTTLKRILLIKTNWKISDITRHYHCVPGIRKLCLRPRSDSSLCRKSFAPVCLIFPRNSRFPLFLTSFYLDICRREIL